MIDSDDKPGGSVTASAARVEFCGESHSLVAGEVFTIGREGDLVIDDNPFLHRSFLQLKTIDGLWWLANVGAQVAATVASSGSSFHAWLAPGSSIPLVFPSTTLRFTAGPTTYEIDIVMDEEVRAADERAFKSAKEEFDRLDAILSDREGLLHRARRMGRDRGMEVAYGLLSLACMAGLIIMMFVELRGR